MAKLDKLEAARREGMAYAYGIAQKSGIDGLKAEIDRRNEQAVSRPKYVPRIVLWHTEMRLVFE